MEGKNMKNKEKWAKEIIEIAIRGERIAVHNGNPVPCGEMDCKKCQFGDVDTCDEETKEWAETEYEEPKIQPEIKRLKVDDKILVSEEGKNWLKRHFAKFQDGLVYAWEYGYTSWSTEGTDQTTAWAYAKLPESEDE